MYESYILFAYCMDGPYYGPYGMCRINQTYGQTLFGPVLVTAAPGLGLGVRSVKNEMCPCLEQIFEGEHCAHINWWFSGSKRALLSREINLNFFLASFFDLSSL